MRPGAATRSLPPSRGWLGADGREGQSYESTSPRTYFPREGRATTAFVTSCILAGFSPSKLLRSCIRQKWFTASMGCADAARLLADGRALHHAVAFLS